MQMQFEREYFKMFCVMFDLVQRNSEYWLKTEKVGISYLNDFVWSEVMSWHLYYVAWCAFIKHFKFWAICILCIDNDLLHAVCSVSERKNLSELNF